MLHSSRVPSNEFGAQLHNRHSPMIRVMIGVIALRRKISKRFVNSRRPAQNNASFVRAPRGPASASACISSSLIRGRAPA
jgi:hypothetical protein